MKNRLSSVLLIAFVPDYPELAIDRPLEIHPHTFRHSWVTHMLEAGIPIHHVKAWAGHSSITTTEIYTHMLPDDGQNQSFMSQLDDYRM